MKMNTIENWKIEEINRTKSYLKRSTRSTNLEVKWWEKREKTQITESGIKMGVLFSLTEKKKKTKRKYHEQLHAKD